MTGNAELRDALFRERNDRKSAKSLKKKCKNLNITAIIKREVIKIKYNSYPYNKVTGCL